MLPKGSLSSELSSFFIFYIDYIEASLCLILILSLQNFFTFIIFLLSYLIFKDIIIMTNIYFYSVLTIKIKISIFFKIS